MIAEFVDFFDEGVVAVKTHENLYEHDVQVAFAKFRIRRCC